MINQRQPNTSGTAVKTTIKTILASTFNKGEEGRPSYIEIAGGVLASRINVIAIIVSKEQVGTMTSLFIDDGSGQILARFFEENKYVQLLKVGEVILIIGRVREYNLEKYVSPEIVKKVDAGWLKVRRKEMEHPPEEILLERSVTLPQKDLTEEKNLSKINPDPSALLKKEMVEHDGRILPVQKILQYIQENDKGEGVLIEQILQQSPIENAEKIISKMLESGDAFQNLPGRIKVL